MATREMAVINDSNTNDVYELRDKKLADAQVSTTPSDITVNSVVPVELEDGSCIKIKRDSLVQAFASVLNSNSQSTITTLFGADSNGNHANINMANLASVLSAQSSLFRESIDYNQLKTPGKYYIYDLAQGSSANRPTYIGGIIEVNTVYPFIKQEFIDYNAQHKYYRFYNIIDEIWGGWKYLTLSSE